MNAVLGSACLTNVPHASQGLTCLVPREATKDHTLGGMRRLGGAT